MKELAILGSAIFSFLTPVQVLAADIVITPPSRGFTTLGNAINNILKLLNGLPLEGIKKLLVKPEAGLLMP
ncbi:hypothetical protein HYU93_01325 [Candidatus Daviesbacteria bacterium]|nr:hypothetical protein [Candidatus Daviesbacteria bacterium]